MRSARILAVILGISTSANSVYGLTPDDGVSGESERQTLNKVSAVNAFCPLQFSQAMNGRNIVSVTESGAVMEMITAHPAHRKSASMFPNLRVIVSLNPKSPSSGTGADCRIETL